MTGTLRFESDSGSGVRRGGEGQERGWKYFLGCRGWRQSLGGLMSVLWYVSGCAIHSYRFVLAAILQTSELLKELRHWKLRGYCADRTLSSTYLRAYRVFGTSEKGPLMSVH